MTERHTHNPEGWGAALTLALTVQFLLELTLLDSPAKRSPCSPSGTDATS